MFKITTENYGYYKKIAAVIWQFLFKDPFFKSREESHPLAVLNNWEEKSMSLARKGLKSGLIEGLLMLKDATEDYRKELNQQLIKAGLPELNKLMAVVNETPVKVLKRGAIKNIAEWYIIKEVLDDVEYPIGEVEKKELGRLFYQFEKNKK